MLSSINDAEGNILAEINVTEYMPNNFKGQIVEARFPKQLMVLFAEYGSLVDAQVFPLLDEIEEKISNFGLTFSVGKRKVTELQVRDGLISFRVQPAKEA